MPEYIGFVDQSGNAWHFGRPLAIEPTITRKEIPMPEFISLMPEPGTPQYDNLRKWMRQAYADPRNVRFRREVNADLNNLGFLTQGGSDPLPDVEDPIRSAVQINVTLLTTGPLDDEDLFMADAERALRALKIETRTVIDVQITDVPERVNILDAKHYQPGDHFQNPLDAE